MTPSEERLKTALTEAYSDIVWNAYCTGHSAQDGMFDNCCLSDAEWLQRAVTGAGKRSDEVPAEWIKEHMAELVEAMVAAVVAGEDPYELSLNRSPE